MVTLQFAKPFAVVAVTPLTVTFEIPESASLLVPLTVSVAVAVESADAGEVIATTGATLSCVEETTLLFTDEPMVFVAMTR